MLKNHLDVEPAEWPFEFFKPWEIACSCCGKVPLTPEALQAVGKLDAIRREFGVPMHVHSGYRCKKHNAAVDGAPNSLHLEGRAFDIDWSRWSSYQRARFCFIAGFLMTGLGQYPGFVHVDDRGRYAFWKG